MITLKVPTAVWRHMVQLAPRRPVRQSTNVSSECIFPDLLLENKVKYFYRVLYRHAERLPVAI
jgi:hypothetical protein